MFFGLFWLLSYSFICFSCRSSKMTSFPLYFLLLFILFPSVLSLFLSLLVFSILSPFSPFQTSFCWSLYYLCVTSCQTLCKKKVSFWTSAKLSFSVFSFPSKSQFSLFPFLLGLSQTNIFFHVLFFCLLKNGFSLCLTLLFLILLVNSVSFSYCPFFWCIQE